MERIYSDRPLDMNQYRIVTNSDSARYFPFEGLCSCSAIVFKCESGYAGFHYAARGLMSGSRNDYIFAMKVMMLDIASSIGNIQKINCFTPILTGVDYFENESYEDRDCIDNFFKDYGYTCDFVSKLEEVNEI